LLVSRRGARLNIVGNFAFHFNLYWYRKSRRNSRKRTSRRRRWRREGRSAKMTAAA